MTDESLKARVQKDPVQDFRHSITREPDATQRMKPEFREYTARRIVNVHKHVDGPWFWSVCRASGRAWRERSPVGSRPGTIDREDSLSLADNAGAVRYSAAANALSSTSSASSISRADAMRGGLSRMSLP